MRCIPTIRRAIRALSIGARDIKKFREYFANGHAKFVRLDPPKVTYACTGPLQLYRPGRAARPICNASRTRCRAIDYDEAYVPANSPGTISIGCGIEYYKTEEEFVWSVADAMRDEYKAIVDAGFVLQIDDPDMPDDWHDVSGDDGRGVSQIRAVRRRRSIMRCAVCRARRSGCISAGAASHGPHHDEIPLKDIVDIIFRSRRRIFDRGGEPGA